MAFYRKYDHLFFDLDNTLWDFDANAKEAMLLTIEKLDLGNKIPDFNTFYDHYENINTGLWELYRKQEIRKSDLIRKRFEDTLTHFSIENIDAIEMNNLYLDFMSVQTKLIEGATETLTYLKSRNYHLHIITNGFKEVQTLKLHNCNLTHFFEGVFISEMVNAPKPDKRIFKHALMNSNARKDKSLMIGDSWETDIQGAQNMGIDQVYLRKNGNYKQHPPKTNHQAPSFYKKNKDTPCPRTYVIEKLTQLISLT